MAYSTINDPSANFQTQLYTGNQSTLNVTNDGNSNLQPDWVWIKNRNGTNWPSMYDSNRGVEKQISSNVDNAQYSDVTGLTAFNTDGFTLGSHTNENTNSGTYVAWQWKANGGTNVSNTDGSITSTVQANTTSGFSIITYTGTGATATVGHGLGTTPNVIIAKNLTNTGGAASWPVYHHKMGNTHYMKLDTTVAQIDSSGLWNDTSPTSSVFTINTSHQINASGGSFVAYCFAEKQGYSKFGSYIGNGNADGPFIYTGFKPAWLMIKRTDSTGEWIIMDHQRTDYSNANPVDQVLYANDSTAEYSETQGVDFLSNGFKQREGGAGWGNASGGTYIYMAFAEQTLVGTNNVIALAR